MKCLKSRILITDFSHSDRKKNAVNKLFLKINNNDVNSMTRNKLSAKCISLNYLSEFNHSIIFLIIFDKTLKELKSKKIFKLKLKIILGTRKKKIILHRLKYSF